METSFPSRPIPFMTVRGWRRVLVAKAPAAVASVMTHNGCRRAAFRISSSQPSNDWSRCQSDANRSRLASLWDTSRCFCERNCSNSFL